MSDFRARFNIKLMHFREYKFIAFFYVYIMPVLYYVCGIVCFFCFFLVYAGSGSGQSVLIIDILFRYWSGQIQNIESLKRLYSVRWGGNKWPRRPLGVNYSVEACSHCVKVGLVVLLLKRELDSLTECLRWWWSGWPPLLVSIWFIPEELGNFPPPP
jgi:hypothetical protein